jgi:cytochrome c biogenesis protein CcmG, thiol:disulfide interchange protein DsbE
MESNQRLVCGVFTLLFLSLMASGQTVSPPSTIKSSAQYVQINTRPKWVLDTLYPYDLTLFSIDSVGKPSKDVLPVGEKPIVLAFWLTTCYPCKMELDAFAQKYYQWKKELDFELVAISIDFPSRFQQIGYVTRQKQYPFPVLWDLYREFTQIMPGGLNGLPQVFVLDKKRNIVYHKRRYTTGDEDTMFEFMKTLK